MPSEKTPRTPTAVHLKPPSPIRRADPWGHAYPLHEPDQPTREASLLGLIRWLAVEQHQRYRPKLSTTYCNVYAHDFCYLAGVYLPRVWWQQHAVEAFERGEEPSAEYGATVGELSANALFRWLERWSSNFGWRRAQSLDELQDAANAGEVAVICAHRKVESEPGHISVVVPETELQAQRREGRVVVPVQSQAGARPSQHAVGDPWWSGAQFQTAGFWRHE